MGTSFTEVIANYGMVQINDQRLTETARLNPALFFRQMWLYLVNGMALFDRPPEMRTFLTNGLTEPEFDNFEWVPTEDSTQEETSVETGLVGFELFTCSRVSYDGAGNVETEVYSEATYDIETGRVTFPVQQEPGIIYTMDFYRDGSFAQDLTIAQKSILGRCMAVVWEERFTNDWLNMQPKIHDKSFSTGSEHGHISANTARRKAVRGELEGDLRKYEQDCAYFRQIRPPNTLRQFV